MQYLALHFLSQIAVFNALVTSATFPKL